MSVPPQAAILASQQRAKAIGPGGPSAVGQQQPHPIEAAAQVVAQTALQISQMQNAVTQQVGLIVSSVSEIANSSVIRPFNSLADAMLQAVGALGQTNQALMSFAEAMVQSLEVIQAGQLANSEAMTRQIERIALSPVVYEWDKDGRVRVSRRELSEDERIVEGMV